MQMKIENQVIKDCKIKQAQKFDYNRNLEQWNNVMEQWKMNVKLTKSVAFKDNLLKISYRWYIPPDKLVKRYKNISNMLEMWKACRYVLSYVVDM